MNEKECCPQFDPAPWNEKEIHWENKPFIKDRVRSIFHIPLNFGSIVVRIMKKIEAHGAQNMENLMLSDENSLWGSDLYVAVNQVTEGLAVEKISGTFLTKVFEGPYNQVPAWIKEMTAYVKSKGKEVKKFYFYYTTCPKCAKKYGKNFVVLFAQI